MTTRRDDDMPTLRIGVIGAGRVGAVLGAALLRAGHEIVGVSAVSHASLDRAAALLPGVPVHDPRDVAQVADVVLLTVPDDALGPLVRGLAAHDVWRPGRVAVQTSGFHGTDVLTPVTEAGGDGVAIHPAMTFSGTAKDLPRLIGLPMAVTASPGAALFGEALALDLGGDPWPLADEDRPSYHTALAHGSNFLITLVAQAQQLLRGVGIDDPSRLLRPLLEAALDNSLESGDKALTGPVARGDLDTVRAHLAVTQHAAADIAEAYRAMAHATALRAAARHTLPAELQQPLLDLLTDPDRTQGPST